MTTLYRNGQFVLVDSVTLKPVRGVAPFASVDAAQEYAGAAWDDLATEAHYGI
jgi:hypothetical protein